jgi:hypothetical protein
MRKLRLTETGYAFPLQLWPQVWAAELRVTELPVRLIYNDLTRTFGGTLDDANRRLKHYMSVLSRELDALSAHTQAQMLRQDSDAEETASRWPATRMPSVCGCCM